jgi:hypothetical protein
VGHVASMVEIFIYEIIVEIPEGNMSLERLRRGV